MQVITDQMLVFVCQSECNVLEIICVSSNSFKEAVFCFKPCCPYTHKRPKAPDQVRIVLEVVVLWFQRLTWTKLKQSVSVLRHSDIKVGNVSWV